MHRRSVDEIANTLEHVIRLLKGRKEGLRAEKIREELGLQRKEMPRVLHQGLATKKLICKGPQAGDHACRLFAVDRQKWMDPAAGGIALFIGVVRDHDKGKQVSALSYTAHPTADEELRQVAERIAAKYDVHAIAAVHRVGNLDIGDLAVVVGVSSGHRATAFDACRALIDVLKETVPIWKHQRFAGGESEWVNTA